MAATIAYATGFNKDGSRKAKTATRVGGGSAEGAAATYRTSASAWVRADGSGFVEVRREGITLHRFDFGPER